MLKVIYNAPLERTGYVAAFDVLIRTPIWQYRSVVHYSVAEIPDVYMNGSQTEPTDTFEGLQTNNLQKNLPTASMYRSSSYTSEDFCLTGAI